MADPDLQLEYRMFKHRKPQIDQVVMVEVQSVDDEGAMASLLEYNRLNGRIYDPSCRELTIVGRTEPAVVVSLADDLVVLRFPGRDRVGVDLIYTAESDYNRRNFVHTIFVEVAKSLGINLKSVYKGSKWCSYDQLLTLLAHRVGSEFRESLRPELRGALIQKLRLIYNDSWRIIDPFLLDLRPVTLPEGIFLCWAFALIRHFEAVLKINGMLDKQLHLSVQDLVSKTRYFRDINNADGDIDILQEAADALEWGIMTEADCPLNVFSPLTEKVNWDSEVTLYKIYKMIVYKDDDFSPEKWDELVGNAAGVTPVAVSILWFDSYKYNRGGQGVYEPTEKEWKRYKKNPSSRHLAGHVMLLAGCLTDSNGNRLLELQDNGLDVGNGDRGFLYFTRIRPSLVIELVELRLFKDPV